MEEKLTKVWKVFERISQLDQKPRTFWIQSVEADYVDAILHFIKTQHVFEEPLLKYSNASEDEITIEEGLGYFRFVISEGLSLMCLSKDAEGKTELVGFSISGRECKSDSPLEPKGECFRKILGVAEHVKNINDLYVQGGVTEYMSDKAVFVLPEFRGNGVCAEFLKCWPLIAKSAGLKIASGVFTSKYSQAAATKVGLKELTSIRYVDLRKEIPHFLPLKIEEHTEFIKFLYVYAN